ncbi:MAG: NFACT family protein [Candidatus Obscuribacterales bacterium]|nr:NFACT family protein [Candidatus Obscuribacterales bacterium]
MSAILTEAKPILLNRRVEKIQQIGRDEVVLSLRSKAGTCHLMVSAQASFGRICLVMNPPQPRSQNPPPFCQLLRKHLGSATLTGLEQLPGERVVDLIFACVDELGNRSTKVLTAEIMGRHSNLILWEQGEAQKILAASHNVTQEMSRQREVALGLRYVRPPKQEKTAIFSVSESDFKQLFQNIPAALSASKDGESLEAPEAPRKDEPAAGKVREGNNDNKGFDHWLMFNFGGLGRHLAEEIVEAARLPKVITPDVITDENADALWQKVNALQKNSEYKPSMKNDLTRFSVLSWWKDLSAEESAEWKAFPSVNDLVDAYFRGVQQRTEMQQLKDRIRSELKTEQEKLEGRLNSANKLLETATDHDRYKQYGDMIFAHVGEINPGQERLECSDLYSDNGKSVSIELNPNLTASQNAQHYYRLFAKSRVRSKTALVSKEDALKKLEDVNSCSRDLERADTMQDLQLLKEKVLDRGKKSEPAHKPPPVQSHQPKEKSGHQRLMSTRSSDGFTIIVGRNKQENDLLVTKLTQAHDIWMHAQGLEGAHVVVKLPNRKDPPQTTLKEAAQLAARFSRTGLGGKIKVAYTYGKYVHKVGKDKPGLVRYENEKTLEVDTAAPMPPSLRRLFS